MRAARSTLLFALIPSVLVGALYIREAAPSVGGGNSGEFQVMSHLLGIAHPPSYPLYLLLAKGASFIPVGDTAWRVNVLTAGFGAAVIFLAGVLAADLRAGRPKAWLAALVTGASTGAMPRLWSLAVEAEVFTLHLSLTLAFWLALQHHRLSAAALLAGLGLANHRTFLFIAASGALYVLARRPAPRTLVRPLMLFATGLLPYLYVLRGLTTSVPYFAPTDVRRLSRADVWYVLQGNATGETGGGAVLLTLLADPVLLARRAAWLVDHVTRQLGPVTALSGALALAGMLGLALAGRRAPAFVATLLIGACGAALFAMSYVKYPDADRYLLPLETLLAIGLGCATAATATQIGRRLEPLRPLATVSGLATLASGLLYVGASLALLATRTTFTRGGYQHHTLANLQVLEPNAVLCTWWNTAWGFWYAQHVDSVRPDVTVVPKGPDECARDIAPAELGRRAVYLPELTEAVRRSDVYFVPSKDLFRAAGSRDALRPGALLRGPNDRVYLLDGQPGAVQRRWIPTLELFQASSFRWDEVLAVPDYVLAAIPEADPIGPLPSNRS